MRSKKHMTAVPKTRPGVGRRASRPQAKRGKPAVVTKPVDGKGRLTLGKEFANRLVIVRELPDGALEVIPAAVIPANEAWLFKNRKAFESLMRGLEQTARGEFAESPDLEADAELARKIQD
jgi:hypothetical protein